MIAKILGSMLCAAMLTPAHAAVVVRLDGTVIDAGHIDATAERVMQEAHVPGLGLAVFSNGTLAYLKAYGERDTADHKPLTPDSVTTAASLTKPAFAALVMRLVEQHALDLDRPIVRYLPRPLPEYARWQNLAGDRRYEQITLRMLLDHTSGFPNLVRFTDDGKLRIYFDPGSRFAYSGEGIALAQFVVETVTGRTIDALMRERIFRPLGMTRTSMVWQAAFGDDYANAYNEKGTSFGAQRRRTADAIGSMQTTLRDYARFVEAMLNGTLLNEKSTAEMFAPQIRITSAHEFPTLATETTHANDAIRLSYGLAWGLFQTPHGQAFFKEGNDNGLRHYVVGFPRARCGMLIMTNGSNGEDTYGPLLEEIIRDTYTPYEWERFKPPERRRPVQ
jgi:CubicO group peptidase (beta-lactamase class C family)